MQIDCCGCRAAVASQHASSTTTLQSQTHKSSRLYTLVTTDVTKHTRAAEDLPQPHSPSSAPRHPQAHQLLRHQQLLPRLHLMLLSAARP
jgi:hypothetical protein